MGNLKTYREMLESEIKEVVGCTEPASVAFAFARAVKIFNDKSSRGQMLSDFKAEVTVSRDVFRNISTVRVPVVKLKGIEPAASCGIYMKAAGFNPFEKSGIESRVDKAESINRAEKNVIGASGDEYFYDKLVLAIGSNPIIPPVKGIELDNIFSVKKDFLYLSDMVNKLKDVRNILILGGGFIGVEFADELISSGKNKNIYIVEMADQILSSSFDDEFASMARDILEKKGVKIMTGVKVSEFRGGKSVEKAILSDGSIVAVDAVVCGIGGVPNTELAGKAGIDMGRGKGIWTDEYMRTSDPSIFAVGDCAGKRDFFTRKDAPVMLASVAAAEARIAGANLYELRAIRQIHGTIGAFSTYVGGLVLGSAGLTEKAAKKGNFNVVTGQAEVTDKHPGKMPGCSTIKMKLIFSKSSGIVLGGQVAGNFSAGEIVNIIGMAIEKHFTATELETFQMATHPYLTPPPTKYHLVIAAQDALKKLQSV